MSPDPNLTSIAPDVVAFDARQPLPAANHGQGGASEIRASRVPGLAWLRNAGPLFWFTVVIPTVLSVLYFGIFASDVFVSESRFVVRSPEKPAVGGIGVLLKTAGFANASDELQAAQGFIQSRDALKALDADGRVRKAYGNDGISLFNRFDPLGFDSSFEDLFAYFRGKVGTEYDSESGITTLSVRAYTAVDAEAINRRLLQLSETLVNQLNDRGRSDLVRYAEREVAEAKDKARAAALGLAAFRNRSGVLDPERQGAVELQMVSKLQDEVIGARMQLLQLQAAAAQNPQIPLLKMRIAGLQRAIDQQLSQVAGDAQSLSATAAQYQRLQLEREFADRQLAASLATLQEARNEARRQRAYVERIAQPSLPDDAMEPHRLRGIITTFILGLVVWGVAAMLFAGVREHQR